MNFVPPGNRTIAKIILSGDWFSTTGLLQSFQTPKMCHLWLISLCEKNALYIKFLLVSYPHFLKISFNLTKCGLSYGFKRDPRPFSEFTQVWTILSLIASKNGFWRLTLIDWKSKVDWKVKLFPIEFPVYQWQPPKSILEAVNDKMVQTCVNSENGLRSRLKP